MNQLYKVAFLNIFKRPLLSFENVGLFKTEEEYFNYFKKVLYFNKAVIEPLEKKGMTISDSIIDIASGDGQMSLALYLKGYRTITMFDLDKERLSFSKNLIQKFLPNTDISIINDTAANMMGEYVVIISYQTIEHLSLSGNYSIASRKFQKDFLDKINNHIHKLCYINAPNYTFPVDGHDTGKLFFHYLPISIRKLLISKNIVKCSWAGISQPVSISFLNRNLKNFKLASNYYAFESMLDYIRNYPPFDYMGNKYYFSGSLSFSKKIMNFFFNFIRLQNKLFLTQFKCYLYKR